MSLEDKLWAIINHHTKSELDRVEQIKQAFTDEGYVQIPQAELDKGGFIQVHPEGMYMTGEYWYNKFEELANSYPPDTPLDSPRVFALGLAKKAAGIKE